MDIKVNEYGTIYCRMTYEEIKERGIHLEKKGPEDKIRGLLEEIAEKAFVEEPDNEESSIMYSAVIGVEEDHVLIIMKKEILQDISDEELKKTAEEFNKKLSELSLPDNEMKFLDEKTNDTLPDFEEEMQGINQDREEISLPHNRIKKKAVTYTIKNGFTVNFKNIRGVISYAKVHGSRWVKDSSLYRDNDKGELILFIRADESVLPILEATIFEYGQPTKRRLSEEYMDEHMIKVIDKSALQVLQGM